MIKIQEIIENLIEVKILGKIETGDFVRIAPQIDKAIQEEGSICLLIDGASFEGWSSIEALKEHLQFVKKHQKKVNSIAVIQGHCWHRWLLGLARMFVHPKIKVFSQDQREEARGWLKIKSGCR